MCRISVLIFPLFFLLLAQVIASPIEYSDIVVHDEEVPIVQNVTVTELTDAVVAQELGVSEAFLQKLKENWDKAVEVEKSKVSSPSASSRQGGIGDFFGLGGGTGGGGDFGAGGGAGGIGGAGAEDDEDDDEEAAPTSPGPGAAGVLTGLFGIFSGVGSLNPTRVVQSTVNFFPPHQREAAQMALNNAFGLHNVTTLAPLTNAPQRNGTARPIPVGLNATTGVPALVAVPTTTVAVSLAKAVPEKEDSRPVPEKEDSRPVPEKEDSRPVPEKQDPRPVPNKISIKHTSLEEDFQNAAFKLNPPTEASALVEETTIQLFESTQEATTVKAVEVQKQTGLAKDFADTAEFFAVPVPIIHQSPEEETRDVSKKSHVASNKVSSVPA